MMSWIQERVITCLLVWSVGTIAVNLGADEDIHQCKGIRTKRHAQISMPPNIGGSWFSPRCELLPGPQYLLRQYEFSSTSSEFTITRYYYSDEFCGEVIFAIQAHGSLTPQSKSWYLNEATDMDIELMDVTVKPYTSPMASVLQSQVFKDGCVNEEDRGAWNSPPYGAVKVNSSNVDCLQSLSFSVNELLVMRQVDYYSKNTASSSGRSPRLSAQAERELQLGDGVWYSLVDRPSSYQPPLYSVTHKHCEACDCIYRADIENPPIRCHGSQRHSLTTYNVTGHWFSQTCESVPYSLFILRSYEFNMKDSTFNVTSYYFTDAFCTQQSFVLRAEGTFTMGQAHSRIYNTWSFQLRFQRLYVGVLSENMLKLVQGGDPALCGHVTNWKISEMYNMRDTNGCSSLGVVLYDSQYVLIKVEQSHIQSQYILLSEMKSNPQRFEDQVTHFTPKLKKCDREPVRWVKRDIDGQSTSSGQANSSTSFAQFAMPHLILLTTLFRFFVTLS
ncbi:protein APCDD1-like [Watersipora subatra]|uniref:protein APCDD1-like n=1 Tax=Watersipora subatra TaxID=2589382 RepID=UPI00355C8D6A